MGYKVLGTLKHDGEVFNHGDSVSASDVGGKENFEQLVAAKGVVTDKEFDELYPEQEGEVVDPAGTPSNLRQVEGTKLQAEQPKDEAPSEPKQAPKNPADPPEVKGAGTPKASGDKK